MYHCQLQIYLAGGGCPAFDAVRAAAPLEHFAHELFESEDPDVVYAVGADLIVANVSGGDARGTTLLNRKQGQNREQTEKSRKKAGHIPESS